MVASFIQCTDASIPNLSAHAGDGLQIRPRVQVRGVPQQEEARVGEAVAHAPAGDRLAAHDTVHHVALGPSTARQLLEADVPDRTAPTHQ